MKNKKKVRLICIFLGIVISILVCKLLLFTKEENIKSPYFFHYQDINHPKAKLLRVKVEPAIEGISNEWEQLIALRKWIKSQWEHGEPQFRTWDALILLNLAGKGSRFWCSQYSIVYVQCCAVLGLPARHLELYTENLDSHAVTEVWSNDYNKWIVMDVDYNCYYIKDGIPLSALEIHNAWLDGETDLIKIERGGTATMPDPHDAHKNLMAYYNHLGYILRNDFLTLEVEGAIPTHKIPGRHPQWVDERTPPLSFYSQITNRISDIYYVPRNP